MVRSRAEWSRKTPASSSAARSDRTSERSSRSSPQARSRKPRRSAGHPEDLGDLVVLEAAEEPQLDDPRQLGVDLGELRERLVDGHDVGVARLRLVGHVVEGDPVEAAGALLAAAAPGVVDQHPAHHRGGKGEEVGAALPVDRALIDQPQEGLVHQVGGLEGVAGALAGEIARGQPAELVVDRRQQPVERLAVAPAPLAEEQGHVVGIVVQRSGSGGSSTCFDDTGSR